MYKVNLYKPSGELFKTYEHVQKISYNHASQHVEVAEENVLTHNFTLNRDFTLHTTKGIYLISKDLISALDIIQEN